jgi:hypothetical protein
MAQRRQFDWRTLTIIALVALYPLSWLVMLVLDIFGLIPAWANGIVWAVYYPFWWLLNAAMRRFLPGLTIFEQ